MTKSKLPLAITDNTIINRIYIIRNQKVMLDRDLAELYQVDTKVLKQSVKRNINRFPDDFMFELSDVEFKNWRSQFVTSNHDKMGLRYAPFAFTEQGVAMLSSILNSEKAILVNIQIIRIFTHMRQLLMDNVEIRMAIEKLEKKTDNNSKNIELVFKYIDELTDKKDLDVIKPRKRIGYKIPKT